MDAIAFIYGNTVVYWSSVMLTLAAATGILFFLSAYTKAEQGITAAALACPLGIVLSLILGRFLHWYFRADSYAGFLSAMTEYTGSGYALSGAFAGCMLTAVILKGKKAGYMLDCMSIGGSGAIALGRLSCLFSTENRGEILSGFGGLPLVWPVLNPVSGGWEYRFAVFFFQSVIAGLIFVILLRKNNKQHRDGDITLTFLLLYCASQIVLDSIRYDALRLRINGFISAVQVFSAITLAVVFGILSRRQIKKNGMDGKLIFSWLLCTAALGLAAFMEYYVQRHGDQALLGYSVMSICMAVIVMAGLGLMRPAGKTRGKFSKQ